MRDDQFITTCSLKFADGHTLDLGVFDSFSGGEGDSEDTKYNEGGGSQLALGGRQTRADFTVGRLFKKDRDPDVYRKVDAARGKATLVAKRQPLDDDGNPFGKPITWRGKVKTVTAPDSDSNSGTNPALWTIACSAKGDLA